MKMTLVSVVVMAMSAAATLIATPVHAQAHSDAQRALFDEVNTNHDGYIDTQEDTAANAKRFKTFDVNGDGKFSRAEMIQANKKFGQSEDVAKQTAQFYLAGMDLDGDDAADWAEYSIWMKRNMYLPFDADHDGRISWQEFILPPSPPAR